MRTVAILCAAKKSVYHGMPGLEVFDEDRDARTFHGGMPVVAHPPCRSWSAKCRHQAKPEPGEQELGLWCADRVRECGGILEQPAHSHLWEATALPFLGSPESPLSFSLVVWQAWWGYTMRKATWLYFRGIPQKEIVIPFRLHPRGGDRRAEQAMSKRQRSATLPAFAEWLVDLARKVTL